MHCKSLYSLVVVYVVYLFASFIAMTPPHGNRETREELNLWIYCLHKDAGWSYERIAKELEVGKLRIQEVVERGNLRGGYVKDAS